MDERPVRCWIHPNLIEELTEWQKIINKIAIEQTGYPIQRLENLPLTSKICSLILRKIIPTLNKTDIEWMIMLNLKCLMDRCRVWLHPMLTNEIIKIQQITKTAKTQASFICSLILNKVRNSLKKGDFKISKDKKTGHLKIEIVFGEKEGDNKNLNIKMQKIIGVKKNEIMFW